MAIKKVVDYSNNKEKCSAGNLGDLLWKYCKLRYADLSCCDVHWNFWRNTFYREYKYCVTVFFLFYLFCIFVLGFVIMFWLLWFCFRVLWFCFDFCASVLNFAILFWFLWFCFEFCDFVLGFAILFYGFVILFCSYRPPYYGGRHWRSRSRGVSAENVPGRGFGATFRACVSFAWEIVRDTPMVNFVSKTMNKHNAPWSSVAKSMLPGNAKCSMTSLADTKHVFSQRKKVLCIEVSNFTAG